MRRVMRPAQSLGGWRLDAKQLGDGVASNLDRSGGDLWLGREVVNGPFEEGEEQDRWPTFTAREIDFGRAKHYAARVGSGCAQNPIGRSGGLCRAGHRLDLYQVVEHVHPGTR